MYRTGSESTGDIDIWMIDVTLLTWKRGYMGTDLVLRLLIGCHSSLTIKDSASARGLYADQHWVGGCGRACTVGQPFPRFGHVGAMKR